MLPTHTETNSQPHSTRKAGRTIEILTVEWRWIRSTGRRNHWQRSLLFIVLMPRTTEGHRQRDGESWKYHHYNIAIFRRPENNGEHFHKCWNLLWLNECWALPDGEPHSHSSSQAGTRGAIMFARIQSMATHKVSSFTLGVSVCCNTGHPHCVG